MLKLKGHEVEVKMQELNFKQRMYKEESIVTVQMMVDFYPMMIDNSIISGGVDIKLDIAGLKSIHELEEQTYEGKVGYVTVTINNHGNFEYLNLEEFKVSFGKINGNKIAVKFEANKQEEVTFEMDMNMVSLYTTGDASKLEEVFELKDFYEEPIETMIQNRKISKYFVRR